MTSTELKYWEQQETKRHNIATEQAAAALLAETNRSNLAQEKWRSEQNSETNRSNLERERLGYLGAMETNRSNLANEQIARALNGIRQYEVDTKRTIADMQDAQTTRASDIKVAELATRAAQFTDELELKRAQINETMLRSDLDRDQRAQLAAAQRDVDKYIAELKAQNDRFVAGSKVSIDVMRALMTATPK